jgi:hypothetical protein
MKRAFSGRGSANPLNDLFPETRVAERIAVLTVEGDGFTREIVGVDLRYAGDKSKPRVGAGTAAFPGQSTEDIVVAPVLLDAQYASGRDTQSTFADQEFGFLDVGFFEEIPSVHGKTGGGPGLFG